MFTQMLAGMFVGSLLTCGVWFFVIKTIKLNERNARREREDIMHSIGEIWVEIDALLSSFRSGTLGERRFRESYSLKIDTLNKLIKPNLHHFDVYYVKYIENQIAEYNRIAGVRGLPAAITAGTVFDSEMETNYSAIEQPEISGRLSKEGSEPAPGSVTQPPETDFLWEKTGEEPVSFRSAVQGTATPQEQPEVTAMEPEKAKGEHDSGIFQTVDDTSVETGGAEQGFGEIDREILSGDDIVLEPAKSETGKEEECAETLSPEPGSPVSEKEEAHSSRTEVNEVVFESPTRFFTPLTEDEKAPVQTENVPKEPKDSSSDLFGEEDFSMETLIDVDIGAISGLSNAKTKDSSVIGAVTPESPESNDPSASGDLEVIIASHASHTEIPAETVAQVEPPSTPEKRSGETEKNTTGSFENCDSGIPEETTYTAVAASEKEKPKALDEDSDEAAFEIIDIVDSVSAELKEKPSHVEDSSQTPGEETGSAAVEETVTGDDIADKIASLESAGPVNKVQKPPAKRSKKKDKNAAATKPSAQKPFQRKEKEPAQLPNSSIKKGRDEENITGDDVADKIDAFFGLFKD